MSGLEPTDGAAAAQPEPPAPRADATSTSALDALDALADLDIEHHPDVYQRIHTELQGALASIDDA